MVYPNKYTDSQVEILGELGVSKQLSASTTSARIALTSTTKRVSIKAVGADMRYTFGGSTIEATTTSHYLSLIHI